MKPNVNNFPDARILVVDDNRQNVQLVEQFLTWAGYVNIRVLTESSRAMDEIRTFRPDIVLLDLHMPKPNGYEILAELRGEENDYRFLPVLVFTADITPEARMRALEAGASDFLTKPGDAQEILLRVRNFLETRRLHLKVQQQVEELEERVEARTAELSQARREALDALARTAEFRDDDTGQHTQRVGELSEKIARELGEPEDFVAALRLAAPLHDVGKVGLTDAILLKPGKYTDDELETMRWHPIIGAKIFDRSESPLMSLAREIALNHHERWDGSGYPNHISGEAIPLAARIVAVADVYDALTSERPYKRAWTHEEAVEELIAQSGKHFDPRVIDAFLKVMGSSELQRAA